MAFDKKISELDPLLTVDAGNAVVAVVEGGVTYKATVNALIDGSSAVQTFSEVLGEGNTTSGQDIIISSGDALVSTPGSNDNIVITPDGTGLVVIDSVSIGDNAIATVGNSDLFIGPGGTGNLDFDTENQTGATNSGDIFIDTGDVEDGIAGNIYLNGGSATGTGSDGSVLINNVAMPATDGSANQFIATDGLGTTSFITVSADIVSYDNTTSGMVATDVQAAIDELDAIAHTPVTLDAGTITQDSASLAGQEITLAEASPTSYGVLSPSDKVKLNNLSGVNTGDEPTFSGTTGVIGAGSGLVPDDGNAPSGRVLFDNGSWSAIPSAPVTSVFGRTGVVIAVSGDYSALQITYDNSTSGMVATTSQAAIDELDGRVDSLESSTNATLADVLDNGNTTGNQDIILTSGDRLIGEKDGAGGTGGAVIIEGGGSSTGNTGLVKVCSVSPDDTSQNSGNVQVSTGNTGTGDAGTVNITGGNSTDGQAGNVSISSGSATGTGTDGQVTIEGVDYPSSSAIGLAGDILTRVGATGSGWLTPTVEEVFRVGAGRSANNTTNVYLRQHDRQPTNITPIILPFNCTLYAMTLATETSATWSGELHIGGTLVPGALASVVSATSSLSLMSVDFNAGDAIQIYCNGSGIRNPAVQAFFRRR
jgi:hypothetical protein